ncbi:ferrous iron transport protein B [cyanobacterium endosymbiont of Rhopalodia gibberula]|uniref:nucleoside recognition domain-containing protein n=1 Tax=cyanobacterium endosymbiont of Rhopalodia gibberula TaxID=1763363 RepID=UPI000DC6DE06|nr:nucleoside recognition domain-containing protein [cyanobacterium endosymbiont of Rhopalodia gibberula]BBA79976.1 ferrous iron transport protein B [cyanobacterium endosymbiont of Rhopalodia gibberula]
MSPLLRYPTAIEEGLTRIESLLTQDHQGSSNSCKYPIAKRSLALLLIQGDPVFWEKAKKLEPHFPEIQTVIDYVKSQFSDPLVLVVAKSRHQLSRKIAESSVVNIRKKSQESEEFFHQLTVNPITGFPLAIIILYLGIYQFIGNFGVGVLVSNLEVFFTKTINPLVNQITATLLPWTILQNLIANEHGIITLGLRYVIAIIFPIVTTFFLMFSLLEDSGYLPRLSLLADRLLKALGLSGRSITPLVLGLGCGTMATMVTRTLESKRERVIATLLLALVVPCSPQLGVILGLLSQSPTALIVWVGTISLIFVIVGLLTAKILPGDSACFYLEIPPLRMPRVQYVLSKTYGRTLWYLKEIIHIFILVSVLIWLGKLSGLFEILLKGLEPIMIWLGLPPATSAIFLYGFFRRDYGAAAMFDLHRSGILIGRQLIVAAVTLTLFIPCLTQFKLILKQHGLKITLAMTSFVIVLAFLMGYLLNQLLSILEVTF